MIRGFTLIETLIYLALFSILIGGAVVCAFSLFETAATGSTYALLMEESDFIAGKIAWAVSGAESISSPLLDASSATLSITPADVSEGDTLAFAYTGDDITLARGLTAPQPLNAAGVNIENVSFTHLANPEGIKVVLSLSARSTTGPLLRRTATTTIYIK
jgi:prepilin-type N-terminal cleavage/methylation domain-containing protein